MHRGIFWKWRRPWLNEQKATWHELAAEYNISAERVKKKEKNAMDKIKEAMLANTHLQLD